MRKAVGTIAVVAFVLPIRYGFYCAFFVVVFIMFCIYITFAASTIETIAALFRQIYLFNLTSLLIFSEYLSDLLVPFFKFTGGFV